MNDEIEENAEIFKTWKGGYFEGNPIAPLGFSTYGQFGYMSILHATYLRCIKPYVRKDTIALEIGPGRGAWTKCMLDAKEIWALDAMSAEFNKFHEYVGRSEGVHYLQVSDFSCQGLPDNHFHYLFSFGCLCHVSFDGISEYATNLFPKMRSGADCFWMVADFGKYNQLIDHMQLYSVIEKLAPSHKKHPRQRQLYMEMMKQNKPKKREPNDGHTAGAGTWYDAGMDRTAVMLEQTGYEVLDKDVGTCMRDPILHFRKP